MKKGNTSTQELLGVKLFSHNGIQTDGHGELVYFMITPTNISVLSRVSIGQKVHHLMQLLSAQPDIEIVCTDARENFDDNKLYLDDRAENEPNKKVRDLLLRDKAFLDDIQLQMSTAREFLFVVRLRNESDEQSFANLNRIEKLIIGGESLVDDAGASEVGTASDPTAMDCRLHVLQIANFIDAIRAGKTLAVTPADGRRAVALIEDIYRFSGQ